MHDAQQTESSTLESVDALLSHRSGVVEHEPDFDSLGGLVSGRDYPRWFLTGVVKEERVDSERDVSRDFDVVGAFDTAQFRVQHLVGSVRCHMRPQVIFEHLFALAVAHRSARRGENGAIGDLLHL
ncbi:hypothetical protein D5400_02325 [Georhizobium profundi]|uniref:Uncharacterized protein n=1 Tax=Georhizobium profundi TaxID=2341112 RepID=A0A3S9AZZ5_9HYPH|nr:hypothetical protein D5400_02325 [Georhizobium profundi]